MFIYAIEWWDQMQWKIFPLSLSSNCIQSKGFCNYWAHIAPKSYICGKNTKVVFVGLSKGVGFIRFDQRVEAERAIQKLNGTIPDGATEPITVKFANSPSSNKNGAALTPLTLAPYLPQTRRFLGPIHHPSSRIRFIMLYTFLYQFNSSSFISCT